MKTLKQSMDEQSESLRTGQDKPGGKSGTCARCADLCAENARLQARVEEAEESVKQWQTWTGEVQQTLVVYKALAERLGEALDRVSRERHGLGLHYDEIESCLMAVCADARAAIDAQRQLDEKGLKRRGRDDEARRPH